MGVAGGWWALGGARLDYESPTSITQHQNNPQQQPIPVGMWMFVALQVAAALTRQNNQYVAITNML